MAYLAHFKIAVAVPGGAPILIPYNPSTVLLSRANLGNRITAQEALRKPIASLAEPKHSGPATEQRKNGKFERVNR